MDGQDGAGNRENYQLSGFSSVIVLSTIICLVMLSNKDRLYVALYARGGKVKMPGGEDAYAHNPLLREMIADIYFRYHWRLLVGPKKESDTNRGMRYHANERIHGPDQQEWFFEELETTMKTASMLLVRVMVGKFENTAHLVEILRRVPIWQGEPGWNCVAWMEEALKGLAADGKTVGTSVLDWKKVRDTSMSYVRRKKEQHRFDGTRNFSSTEPPTFDMMKNTELTE
jgi:hypothetical protein